MNRRDFVKFLGVSSASIPMASALANIPEVEPKIILLDTPKEIIIANTIQEVDFIVKHLVNIHYVNKENVQVFESLSTPHLHNPTVGQQQINIRCVFEFLDEEINLFKRLADPRIFTFNLNMGGTPQYAHLMELNGRKFMLAEYAIESSNNMITRYSLNGIEVS